MKKLFLLGVSSLAMVACTNHDDFGGYSKENQYQQVFEQTFGKVNPNVNWGFSDQKSFVFDKDGKLVGTRGADPNANLWGNYLEVPEPMTEEQKDVVRQWFQTHQNPKGEEVNWSDFFIQQVYKGGTNIDGSQTPEKYECTDINGQKKQIVGSDQMDWLACGSEDEATNDHSNNFNGGQCGENNNILYTDGHTGSDRIMYMTDYRTTNFGFHESYGQHYYNDSYVLIPGYIISPLVKDMYFVGFDYKTTKEQEGIEVKPDGYYSDWIVRVVPGINKPSDEVKRVMVEDIIDSDLSKVDKSDWDFNDAVFDVRFEVGWVDGTAETNWQGHYQKYAVITLHAAGGTKPLYIGDVEVHEALGVDVGTMVNTGNGATCPVAIFRIPVDANVNNASQISVRVGDTTLEANQGQATQKFAVPITVKWMKERKLITNEYTTFKDYVNNNTPQDWYNTTNGGGNLY